MTTNESERDTLAYLTQDVHGAWEVMTAAVRLGDRAAYEEARKRFLDGEAKAYELLVGVESER